MTDSIETILVTGGAGYVGAILVPELLNKGYKVKVLDLYLYGDHVLNEVEGNINLKQIKGDIRDQVLLKEILSDCDKVIHLACISNDPSFDLDPKLGKSINHDAFEPLVNIAKESGVKQFIYASSSSVYGIKEFEQVTEDMSLNPLTDYSKYKALCEKILINYQSSAFNTVAVRPATVCGYSPRQRLDVIVNILTNHAVNNGVIKIFGGKQKRPNIHIKDMVNFYMLLLKLPAEMTAGQVYNVGFENYTVKKLAEIVHSVVGPDVEIVTVPTDDPRSYHISSKKISLELDFNPMHTIEEAVVDLKDAFKKNKLPNSMNDSRYYNIRRMQELATS